MFIILSVLNGHIRLYLNIHKNTVHLEISWRTIVSIDVPLKFMAISMDLILIFRWQNLSRKGPRAVQLPSHALAMLERLNQVRMRDPRRVGQTVGSWENKPSGAPVPFGKLVITSFK